MNPTRRPSRRWLALLALSAMVSPFGCNDPVGSSYENNVHDIWISYPYDTGVTWVAFVRGVLPIPMGIGQSRSLTVRAKDLGANDVSCTVTSWTVDDPTIAAVTRDGVLTGLAPGTTVVRARAECRSGNDNPHDLSRDVEVSEGS